MEKKCVKCGVTKSITQFNFKNKAKGKRNARCKECTRRDIMSAYYKNRDHYIKYRVRRNQEVRKEVHRFLFEYLSKHPCVDCGEKDIVVLQFDHVKGEKREAVSILVARRHTVNVVKKEIEKCEVRCANCHFRKTARDFGHYALQMRDES